jgi:hypothetical protein
VTLLHTAERTLFQGHKKHPKRKRKQIWSGRTFFEKGTGGKKKRNKK